MSEEKNIKNPVDAGTKPLKKRLGTIIGGIAGIVVLLIFAILFLQSTAKVNFYGNGGKIYDKSFIIDDKTFLVETPKDPTRNGYDFQGWFTELKDGEKIDFTTHQFKTTGKQFKFFGKEKEIPQAANVFARWALHEYIVEVIDANTGEAIVLYDADGNALEDVKFYVVTTVTSQDHKDEFIEKYIANMTNEESTPEDVKKAEEAANRLVGAEAINYLDVYNLHLLTSIEGVEFSADKDDTTAVINPLEREQLVIEHFEDGTEKPVLTIYVHNYNPQI